MPKTPLNLFVNESDGVAGVAPAPGVMALPSIVPAQGNEIAPRVMTIDLDNAQSSDAPLELDIPSNIISVPWATDSTVVVGLVYHDADRHEPIKIGKNYFWGGVPANKVYLSWDAQAGKQIQISLWQDPNPRQMIRAE